MGAEPNSAPLLRYSLRRFISSASELRLPRNPRATATTMLGNGYFSGVASERLFLLLGWIIRRIWILSEEPFDPRTYEIRSSIGTSGVRLHNRSHEAIPTPRNSIGGAS